MKLTRKQIAEIVEYDHDERERCRWDARRYGSISNPDSIPEGRVNVPTPRPAECCVEKARAVLERKTLRYNYIVPDRSGDHRKRGVTVCHVGVRLTKDYRPRVKILSMAHLAGKGCKTILSGDIDYRMVAGWIVIWESEELSRKNDARVDVTNYGRWWRAPYGEYAGLAFPWHATINPDALSDTRYRWCGWRPGCGIGLIDFLDLYDRFPKIEFLAKANLFPSSERLAFPRSGTLRSWNGCARTRSACRASGSACAAPSTHGSTGARSPPLSGTSSSFIRLAVPYAPVSTGARSGTRPR